MLSSAFIRVAPVALALAAVASLPSAALASPLLAPHTSSPAFMTAAGANGSVPVLFVSDDKTNAVYLFNADNLSAPPLGKITNGIDAPTDIAVDTKGVLYVANARDVAEYQPGALTPFRHLSLGITPASIAVSADGTLAVAGERAFEFPGKLFIFDKGALTPTRTITIPLKGELLERALGVAIDASDDVVLSISRYPDGGEMLEYLPGSTNGINTNLGPALGEAFDAGGNFYLCLGSVIDEYAAGSRQLIRRVTNGLQAAAFFAVTPDGRIFAQNAEQHDFGTGKNIPGDIVEYGSTGPNPVQKLKSGNVVDPRATAYRAALS